MIARQHRLFTDKDISQVLSLRYRNLHDEIESLTDDEVMANDIELLAHNFFERFRVDLLALLEEDVSKRKLEPCRVMVTDTFEWNISGPTEVDGLRASFAIPFLGEEIFLDCRASTFSMSGTPEATIRDGYILLRFDQPVAYLKGEDASQQFLSSLTGTIENLKRNIGYVNKDLTEFNTQLTGHIDRYLVSRKERAELFFGISKALEVPITPSEYKKHAVEVERTIRPIAHSYGREDTWQISEVQYSDILSSIKHMGSTFERTPDTYQSFSEEQFRNVILAMLNGDYKGLAGGECFRGNGKTDICIEQQNRAAFIAECKMWKGAAQVERAIKQLDGYTTWRDCKTALIFFSRNVSFSNVIDVLHRSLESSNLVQSIYEIDRNEYECTIVSRANVGFLKKCRVFAFDVHSRPQECC